MNPNLTPPFFLKNVNIQDLLNGVAIKFQKNQLSLSTAESCTGGLFSTLLTELSGSSRYFHGGVIAYDNRVKTGILGVSPQDLETHGAVSWEVAESMALGIKSLATTDISISFTGIAGPSGGSEAKPVGLVFSSFATSLTHQKARFDNAVRIVAQHFAQQGVMIHQVDSRTELSCNIRIFSNKLLIQDGKDMVMTTRSKIRWISCLVGLEILLEGLL